MSISRAWAFQRSFIRRVYNREIYHWFRDIPESALPSNSGGRIAARSAVLIGANDDKATVQLKITMFEKMRQSITLLPQVGGIPYADIDNELTYRPKVTLTFLQDFGATPDGQQPTPGIISFRLINETPETITTANLAALAREIKAEFALGNGFLWRKGKVIVSSRNQKNGLPQKILCLNEAEGKEIYQKVCRVLDRPYDDNDLNVVIPQRPSITNPTGSVIRLGRRVKARQWRPVTTVRFQYAMIKIHGIVNEIPLVDRTKTYWQAYEYL